MKKETKPQLAFDFSKTQKELQDNCRSQAVRQPQGKQVYLNTREHVYSKILNRKME